jgi:outer membrane receptor protein involved in Fe transport
VQARRRFWIELGSSLVGDQNRLNPGDVDDERIGASRRRSDIASFFASSVVNPYLSEGVFRPTGETLRQIQDRVLPLGSIIHGVTVINDNTRVPLYLRTDGWFTLDMLGGLQLGEGWSLAFGATNLLDRNYRVHGSGVDSPGTNVFLGLRWLF